MASVITNLSDKRRQKQWKFERGILRHLSIKGLKKHVEQHFRPIMPFQFLVNPFLLDPIMDLAIDAYLIGAEFSRICYLGETDEEVKLRCQLELQELSHSLFHILYGWFDTKGGSNEESLSILSDTFVDYWWERGLQEGKKRYRMKLH
ncbi:DUF2521 family protein [Alkalihalobacillus trypoxylicola]|uniref:DUF2521 domain-containing protein n=1 Tax=Alkalihalobacillus trypoxylicola TaxID=519424 RepID=A0A162EW31_9BACI|nr:DUF2521 family protein [Alkalihalobacillus trypoxylicola]KYG33874.1 hypothetical protein AZF04_15275 [Alkalihalobacillus trypoxylicola]